MAMKEKRYAEALVSLSIAQDALQGYQQDLAAVTEVYNNEAALREFLLDPGTDTTIKKALINAVFNGQVRIEIVNMLMLLVDKGSISILPHISKQFAQMADEKRNILNIEITAYEPLNQAQMDQITEKFRKQFGAVTVNSTVKVDKSLLGGVTVKIGDKFIDGSVAGSLKALKGILVK